MFIGKSSPDGLDNEGIYSFEAGYTGRLNKNLSLDIDVYYQRMDGLMGVRNVTDMSGVHTETFGNIDGANAYGEETSLTWQHKMGTVRAWYAYNALVTDECGQVTRSISPSQQKAGLSGRWYVDKDWTFNTNYAFQSAINTFGTAAGNIKCSDRLDLTLSRKFAKGKGEFMVGVMDVFNKNTEPVYDSVNITALETPGRTFFARLQFAF